MSPPRVEFVVGGVQKGGTTALAKFLARHPGLALPRDKEAHVFDAPDFDEAGSAADVDARYAAHFDDVATAATRIHGDATPVYVFLPRIVRRIAAYNPRMRWILILRHPVERAYSHYRMERQRGWESWPFWPAMLLERWRLRGHLDDLALRSPLRRHSYRRRGDYAAQLSTLYAHFPREQVLVLRNEELAAAPAETLARVCRFLGVEPVADMTFSRVFEGGYPPLPRRGLRWRVLRWLLRREMATARTKFGLDWA